MPEVMADSLKQAFIDVGLELYSNKLKRTRLFIQRTAQRDDKDQGGGSSLGGRPKTAISGNKEDPDRFRSASDAFFNSISPRAIDTSKPWVVLDVKDFKSSGTKNSLRSSSMVSLDRIQSANSSRNRKHSRSSENIHHSRNTASRDSLTQNRTRKQDTNALNSTHVHAQSSNPVKPVIKDNNRFKSASTNNLNITSRQLNAIDIVIPDQHNKPADRSSKLKSASAVGSNRFKESIKDRITLNHALIEDYNQESNRPKTASKKTPKEKRSTNHSDLKGHSVKQSNNGNSGSKLFDEKQEKHPRGAGSRRVKSSHLQSLERIDQELDVTRVASNHERSGLNQPNYRHNRNRSQSPAFIQPRTSNRSRSLSARRPEARLLPPSGRNINKDYSSNQDSGLESARSHSRLNSGHSRTRGRRSSVPYVKWKQQQQLNIERGSTPVEGMNGESLPPITSNRSESALSKRSSRESVGSASGSIPRGTVFRYEKPILINIDDSMQVNDNPIKRSHLSPASQKSGSSGNSKGKANGYNANSRNKSWTTADSTKAATLETLFEQKNASANLGDNNINAVEESAIDSGYNSYNNVNGYSRTMKNPNKERRGSIVSSTVNGKLSPGKRTQSFSNITNPSDNSKDEVFSTNNAKSSSQNNKGTHMQRIRSENNMLSVPQSNDRSKNGNKSLRSQSKSNGGKTFSRTASQPVLMPQNESELNAKNIKRNSKLKTSTGSISKSSKQVASELDDGSDGEKNDRIVQWLIGVETAEAPPTPDIAEEEPVQTDTAIHVVYNGD